MFLVKMAFVEARWQHIDIMRKAEPKIVKYRHSQTSPWMITGLRVDGKRKRLFFKTESDAKAEFAKIKIKQKREGQNALAISDELRVMAVGCERDLSEEFPGKTIRDATDHYLKYLRANTNSVTVDQLKDEFIQAKKVAKRSKIHLSDSERRLGRFAKARCHRTKQKFSQMPVRLVETQDIERWLAIDLKDLSPTSINNYRSRVSSLFTFGIKRRYLEDNPASAIDKVNEVGPPPEIFSPSQLRAVLESAESDVLPLIAIGAFAGLRSAELLRLDWQEVDVKGGFIHVKAAKSKTARRRTIEMSPNLRAWLGPYAGQTGPVWRQAQSTFYWSLQQALKKACRPADTIPQGLTPFEWAQNGLRHSFASYHLAKHRDAKGLALDMGHVGQEMIFEHYRELVSKEEAERYWNIFPARVAQNVVPMAQTA